MGYIREPKDVDFTLIDNPWTEEERRDFSELIKKDKIKHRTRLTTSIRMRKEHFA